MGLKHGLFFFLPTSTGSASVDQDCRQTVYLSNE